MNILGVSNSQICRDIEEPMSQEFVTELDANEGKLNEEIDYLLDGIDFQQSLSQEKSPTCIPSSFPEENGCIQNASEDRDEVMSSPILFTPENKEEQKSTIPVIQPFTCSEEKSPVYHEDILDILEEIPFPDIEDTYLNDEQFNQKYPQHPAAVSASVNTSYNPKVVIPM